MRHAISILPTLSLLATMRAGELFAHIMDNEHSELLVAAPVSAYTYNLDPGAYSTCYDRSHEQPSITTFLFGGALDKRWRSIFS